MRVKGLTLLIGKITVLQISICEHFLENRKVYYCRYCNPIDFNIQSCLGLEFRDDENKVIYFNSIQDSEDYLRDILKNKITLKDK